jgi:quercetin dioxygenase-like cupin family protein
LRDLGRATGFSISFLSLVERGRSSLSVASLHAIAAALGVEMVAFFRERQPEPSPPAQINRRCRDARLPIRGAHACRLLGATGFERSLEPMLVTIEPDEEARPRDDGGHEGEEFAYVLSGELVFTVDDVEHMLEAGDCIHYRSMAPHVVRNNGERPAEVLWVLTPQPC